MLQKIHYFLNHLGFTVFSVILLTFLLYFQNYSRWTDPIENSEEVPIHVLTSDGCGYYAYLPQVFIYKTKHFEFADKIEKKYPTAKFFQGLSHVQKNGRFNKYFIGTAICISPFFWIADQVTKFSGGEADGYSLNYEISLLAAAIAYWLLGVISLIALLKSFHISNGAILFGITGLTFATNLNYYIIYDPAFSHAYTFGIICFLLLQVKKYVDSQKGKHLVWILFLLGLITITRPTNLVVALIIPFFFSSFQHFLLQLKTIILTQKTPLISGLLIFSGLVFLQFLNIKSQEGYWGFNAYSAEGFDYLFSPKITEVLFSFRKGFFIYTPFMLLLFPALYFLFKWNRYFFYGFLLFTIVFVYIMASWWCWFYGGSLGMRPLVDVYGILIIPVILLFHKVRSLLKITLIIFMGLMIRFNFVLNYQISHAILHYSDMNKERFFEVFMHTGDRFQWIFHVQNPDFDEKQYPVFKTYVFNQKKRRWEESTSPPKTPETGSYLTNFIYHPEPELETSRIVMKIKYSMQIENERSIPKVLLFGYKDRQMQEISVNFIGPQIRGTDRYYPIDAALYSERKYSEFDSLELILENGVKKGWIKDASCTFYNSKDTTKTRNL